MIEKQLASQVIMDGIPEIVISDEKSSIWFLAITIHDEVIFIFIKYVMEIHGFFECYLI